jgi:hypothetical protein
VISARWMGLVAAITVGAIAGIGLGWVLWKPKQTKAETYAPTIVQKDGSIVAERKPMKPEDVVIPHQVPQGATVQRTGDVLFRPSNEAKARTSLESLPDVGKNLDATSPFRIDWSLVKMKDDSLRMIFSSKDGQIVGATDIPLVPGTPSPKALKWAAGGLWNPVDRTYGAWIQRDLGPVVVGVDVFQTRYPSTILNASTKWSGNLRVGLRF